jgi:hypothetical protein
MFLAHFSTFCEAQFFATDYFFFHFVSHFLLALGVFYLNSPCPLQVLQEQLVLDNVGEIIIPKVN